MARQVIASFLVLGLFIGSATAQAVKIEVKKIDEKLPLAGKKKTTPTPVFQPKNNALPGEVDVFFLNGSNVRMLVKSDKLEIATIYGKLSVPVKDVRGVEFGLHFPTGFEDRIGEAIKELDSKDFRQRERASKTLVDLGPYSYPAVHEASLSKNAEIAPRAKDIVKKLKANHAKKDLKNPAEDRVITGAFTIVGRILTPTIKAKTDLFGEVELNVADMRMLRALHGLSLAVEVSIDAGKYANQGQWMETSYQYDGRSPLVISAKGMIDTWPQNPGQYVCGPNGTQNNRNMGMRGGMRFGKGGVVAGPMYSGVLLGKIGEDGEMFVVGEHYEGTPDREGKIYLHIGPSQWNCQSMGTYDVKIGRKGD